MSRTFVLAIVAGMPLVAGIAGTTPPAMFRGGPEHLGIYASPSPTLARVAWKFRTEGRVVSSPVVSGDAVYFGSHDGHIYAVGRSDGALRWKFATEGPVASSPAVASGVAIASSVDGRIYAVDVGTGKMKWTFVTEGERRFTAPGIHGAIPRTERMPDPFDIFLSSPAVAGNTVYIGSGDSHVYALDLETGRARWRFRTGDVVHASPAVSQGVVYIGSWDRNMYALDAESGRELWRFQTGNDTVIYNQVGIASSAAVANGAVYFGCRDGHFYAVDARTGRMLWKHDNRMGWTIASPAVRDGVVYFPTSDGTRFKALEAATGTVKFDIQNKAVSFSSPALVGDIAYYGSSDGWLQAVNVRTGAMHARFQSDGSKRNGAEFTDSTGRLLTGRMYPDRTLDGMITGLRTMFTLGSFVSSPSVADGVLYIGSTDGQVYAIR